MIFTNEDLRLELVDVLYFDETDVVSKVRPRTFFALSVRLEGDTEINYASGSFHLTSGDIALFPAGLGYTRKARRDRMIVFHFRVPNYSTCEISVLQGADSKQLLPYFESALNEWSERSPGYRYRASASLYSVFGALCTKLCASDKKISAPISEALNYIYDNYRDPSLSVAKLAKLSHMCETYFRRKFASEVGSPPKAYINAVRMENANSLLKAGYQSVAEISELVGFRDAKNFSTAYKKRYGQPPSKVLYNSQSINHEAISHSESAPRHQG